MSDPFVFHPIDPAIRRDPYPHYARGRDEFPLWFHEGMPVPLYSAFRYEDCLGILRDDATWSSDFRSVVLGDSIPDEDEAQQSMLGLDGEAHHRLRGLVNKAFTPRIVSRLEPRMREMARRLVDEAVAKGEVDLVQALTYPLPVAIIAEIIGVPPEDREQFKGWSDKAIALLGTGFFGGVSEERLREQMSLFEEMNEYFIPLAEARARDPKDDLLTGLVQARHEGTKLDHAEMLSMLTLLLVAGNETTTTLIGNTVLTLLAHPDVLERLRRDRSLRPGAIEEVVRFTSPVQFDPRRATRTVELHGRKIEENQMVLCWLGSANRDGRVFENPDRFDPTRPRQPQHLGFGFGVHYCLGANLARLEATVALDALLDQTTSFERTTSDDLPLHPSPVFFGFTSLPVRLKGA